LSYKRPVSFVVWDLDGTLADTAGDIARALDELLTELDLDPLGPGRARALIGHGARQLVYRGFADRGIELDNESLATRTARFIDIYASRPVGETRLYPGIASALERLAAAGVRQAVCTNKPAAISEVILETLGIRPHFACVTGGDTTARRKPDPAPLAFTVRALSLHVRDGLMIGDSQADAGAARAAGMRVAIVDYGYSATMPEDCDYRVADIDAFCARIAGLRG
jgi:phosphoglycolate phosphatase